jgi:hypothetical protein
LNMEAAAERLGENKARFSSKVVTILAVSIDVDCMKQ